MPSRQSKKVTSKADMDYLINIEEKDITTTFIANTFGDFDGKRRFNPYDLIDIPPGMYGKGKKNKNTFTTTVGSWIFNKYFIEQDLFDQFGYITDTINKKMLGKLDNTIYEAVLEDKLDIPVYKKYLKKTQKFMPYISIYSPSHTDKILTSSKVFNKKKMELYKKYKDKIDAGDEKAADAMTKELLDFAIEYMGDDPSMDLYLSGARGTLHNNFKNMYVMKGAIKDPDPNAKQKYNVALSNYIDGIQPNEYVMFANSLTAGPYARAKKTADGGYSEQLILSACQHLILDPPGSDCGTKRYHTVTLTNDNIGLWMYSYIVEGSKLVELTSDVKSKYIGKTVKVRFSGYCESKTGICNKCMGNLYYRLGKRNVGTSMSQIASIRKNIAMKAFHDSTQSFYDMDLESVFGVK